MTAGALLSQLSQSVSIKCKLCSSWQVHSNHWIGINRFACSPGGGGNDAATQALITGAFEEKKKIAMARAQALADTLAKSESLRKGAVLASSRGASGTCQWFNGMTKVYLMCVCVWQTAVLLFMFTTDWGQGKWREACRWEDWVECHHMDMFVVAWILNMQLSM